MPTRLKSRMIATFIGANFSRNPKYSRITKPMKISRMRMNFPCVIRYVLHVS